MILIRNSKLAEDRIPECPKYGDRCNGIQSSENTDWYVTRMIHRMKISIESRI